MSPKTIKKKNAAEALENPKANPAHAGKRFFNRDLSWLEFNARVLSEALDERTPLLERLRFLSIFSSNLDEFFMKRVGVLKDRSQSHQVRKVLHKVREKIQGLLSERSDCFENGLQTKLKTHGIIFERWKNLGKKEQTQLTEHFKAHIFPVLTPLAVDAGHPFPFISNLSLSLGVTLRQPGKDEKLFARVKIPQNLPQWIRVGSSFRFLSLIDLITVHLEELFPSMVLLDVMPFRVTRNISIEREEDADDILEMVEEELQQRRFAQVVRLEHGPRPDPWMLQFLIEELGISTEDVYEVSGDLDYRSLKIFCDLDFPDLKYSLFNPVVPAQFKDGDKRFFATIKKNDVLVHMPYESFSASVESFVRIASLDPKVLAIKMTLYRTDENSPFIKYLIRAAEEGKHVVCLIELTARFDEERNIFLAQQLEKAGVHVVYGVEGFKTHTKLTLVVREETSGIRSYCHIGTGNYHSQTAKLYTDLGLFTANRAITSDVVDLFHYLTGRSLKKDYRKLFVAPINMRDSWMSLIDKEKAHAKAGRPARIIAKMNSLEDTAICEALYSASQAGVKIDLIVRGFCTLRPGVAGMSENIKVVSVIGRFLEHSRIFYFAAGNEDPAEGKFFVGSADWMYRNLNARVEAIAPVEDRNLRAKLWEILQQILKDHRQTWDLSSKGKYKQRRPLKGSEARGVQEVFLSQAQKQAEEAKINEDY